MTWERGRPVRLRVQKIGVEVRVTTVSSLCQGLLHFQIG